ncbi:MAG: HAMP domain-containing histidine kinase [Phenylobacterium sp.]|uniref:sensor histidine kinase n=1 Tax=Phenylobacterium sp. TaxID=1871053 RepID=UPI00121C001E|nr:HAMP domain-containing sensor histidine kinase [Phenylobacterium sp.]TAJ70969.1 MAG: HAMP domain-containing histidine kinase [Phenylobacterium sp.]
MRLKPWIWPAAAALVALAALVVGLLIVDRLGERAIAQQQTAMAGAARDYFVAFARDEGVRALADTLNRHAQVGAADGFRYALEDQSGRMLAGADVVSSLDAPDAGWRTVTEPDSSPRRLWRVLAQPLGGGYTLIVAEDLAARDALRAAVFRGSALAILIAALGAAAAGFGLNAVLLRRTRAIAHTAERIAGGDLSARAPVRPKGDVFDDLGASMNVMLGRIEELMTGMRTVADSIAHDLRSPLTRMKGALVRAADPHAPEAVRLQALDDAHAEADTVLATLNALLDIAHAESGLSRENMQRIDVAALVLNIAELFGPVIEDAGQALVTQAPNIPVLARAHPDLLRQAVGNLLHNAVIHAGPGATVVVRVEDAGAGRARICVADDGPGVPPEHLGRVQERFVRLEASRTTPGSGLGLALVAACAKLHGGRLVLGDNRPGLVAALELSDQRS